MPDERKMDSRSGDEDSAWTKVRLRRYKRVNIQKPNNREHSVLYQVQNQAPCWPIQFLKGLNTSLVIKLPHSPPPQSPRLTRGAVAQSCYDSGQHHPRAPQVVCFTVFCSKRYQCFLVHLWCQIKRHRRTDVTGHEGETGSMVFHMSIWHWAKNA